MNSQDKAQELHKERIQRLKEISKNGEIFQEVKNNSKRIEETKKLYYLELEKLVERVKKILNAVATRQRVTVNEDYTIRDGDIYVYGRSRSVKSLTDILNVLDGLSKEDFNGEKLRYKVVKKLKNKVSSISNPYSNDFSIEPKAENINKLKSYRLSHGCAKIAVRFEESSILTNPNQHKTGHIVIQPNTYVEEPSFNQPNELHNLEVLSLVYNDLKAEQEHRIEHNKEQTDLIQTVYEEIKDEGIGNSFLVTSFLK